jgi:RNA polymerase sigma-70 factor (ECF subfamily)
MDSSNNTNTDQLLQRAREGDERCLAQLLEFYRPYLHLLARLKMVRQLKPRLDDSDLVQETELLALRGFPEFQGKTAKEFTAWMRQIMAHVGSNLVRDHGRQCRDVRRERRFADVLNQSSRTLEQALISGDSSPSEKAQRRERAVLLAQALDQLPEDYRDVLIFRELEGMTMRDVADRMGRSVDSVQKLWARALIRIRRLMQSELELS